MREYDVDIWTDYNKFYLIVSAEHGGQAEAISLQYLIENKLVKDGERLTRQVSKEIERLEIPAIQWLRGSFG